MPETFPYCDSDGVCAYCRTWKPIQVKARRRSSSSSEDGSPDVIVAFPGGRDSSYGLHYVKKVLGMNPIAFTHGHRPCALASSEHRDVAACAVTATNFAILTASDGRFYFTLTAANCQVVGISQMYTTQLSAQAGIKSVTSTLAKLDIL